jgi:hypothetical protein
MVTSIETLNHGPDARLFDALVKRYRNLPAASRDDRWLMLEAAHVVGQTRIGPHLRAHGLMLALAWEAGNWHEVSGQLFRIALVPLGHLTGRLPLGNPGKADVSAFESMPVRPELDHLISLARQSVQTHDT